MDIPKNWTFESQEIATGFDRHVREQLPWYDLMSGAVAHIARHYIPEGGVVLDLGCSTGNIGNLLRETLTLRHCEFHPIDNSLAMRERYTGPGTFELIDIGSYKVPEYDVAIAFLSLMFIQKDRRRALLSQLRTQLRRGGALIIVDKAEAYRGYLGTVLSRLTLAGKVATGVTPQEIIEKELSLIGVQRPLAHDEMIGFAVEVFRFGEFCGWVIEG